MSDLHYPILTESTELGETVGANLFVAWDGELPDAEGDPVKGLTRQAGADGDVVGVVMIGTQTAIAGAVIAAGKKVMAMTSGRAKEHTGSNAVAGVALEAAAAIGDEIKVFVQPEGLA